MTPLIIIGCGFVGGHLARAAVATGRPVRVLARSTGRLAPLSALGVEVKYLDVGLPTKIAPAISSLHGATVVYSVPPVTSLPPGQAVRAALTAAYGIGANSFIYLSSSGLYGDRPDDDVWIDEDTSVDVDHGMQNVKSDEDEVLNTQIERLRTIVLRLAPVYAKGKGIRGRLRKGEYRLLDEGEHAISRIYIDDLVRIIFAAEEKAPHRALYMVGDDEPTTQRTYATWLCDHLGLPMPESKSLYDNAGKRVLHRNRKIQNARLKAELGIELKYPSFRDGELAIDAAEAAD
ncbi:SDR family oxidoreductase [soil metagenome]